MKKNCNKKVLFLTGPSGEYPQMIKNELEKMGYSVDVYFSSPTNNFLCTRLLERIPALKVKYYNNIINDISSKTYDYVFVINAGVFPEYFLKKLYEIKKDTKKILYSWDSIQVYPQVLALHKYFDKIYSFDSEDVKTYSYMSFLPLFYSIDPIHTISPIYDFSFVGFAHTERYKFIKEIEKFADDNGYNYCFKLYLPSFLHYLRGKYITKIFPNAHKNDFIFKQISLKEMSLITSNSKIVVDLELKTQSGLTMRTIESHGLHKKLITTNPNIINYDFYNPNNILIVDRNKPIIPQFFLETPYKECEKNLYLKYSLTNWLRIIFENCEDIYEN